MTVHKFIIVGLHFFLTFKVFHKIVFEIHVIFVILFFLEAYKILNEFIEIDISDTKIVTWEEFVIPCEVLKGHEFGMEDTSVLRNTRLFDIFVKN